MAVPAIALVLASPASGVAQITSADIKDQTIQSVDIGRSGVGTSEVRNQSLTSIDLARGSVGASELRNGSVRPWDLEPEFRKFVERSAELESDGPYPGATNLTDGDNSTDKWAGDQGVALQSSWVMCPEGKTAIGGGFSRADEGAAAFKGLQVVTSQPVQVVDGNPAAYNPIEGDADGSYVPNGWLVEGFNNNDGGDLIVRPHVVCAKIS